VLIDAPPRTVAGLLRDREVAASASARCGHHLTTGVRLFSAGDQVGIAVRVAPGIRVGLRTVIDAVSEAGMRSVLASGPLRELVHTVTLTPTGAGTLVLDELRWTSPLGPLGRLADVGLIRRLVLRMLAARSQELVEQAAALVAGPVVVATALFRDGLLLIAQRTRPPAIAGRWELPGGRVEPGESEPDAVVRECREELDAVVRVTGRLGTDLPIDAGVLRVHRADLAPGSPEPRALEHAALRWVRPEEVPDVDWVDADRAVVADLVEVLRSGATVTECG
jgi:8-oxo-dGTP diphosphatase